MLFALCPHADTEEGQNNGQMPPFCCPGILHYSVLSSASASLFRVKVKWRGNSHPHFLISTTKPQLNGLVEENLAEESRRKPHRVVVFGTAPPPWEQMLVLSDVLVLS